MKLLLIPALTAALMLGLSGSALAAPRHHQDGQSRHHVRARTVVHRSVTVRRTNGRFRHRTVRTVVTRRHRGHRTIVNRRTTVNVRRFRGNFHARRHFHVGFYYRPRGWYPHRWVYGERLPRAWFVSRYWIPNYVVFGLLAPPYGYRWVRVGSDALLINIYSGTIIRVVYGVFI